MVDKTPFLDLKVPVFLNKNTGQISISLPKKQLKTIIAKGKPIPNKINIRLFKFDKTRSE